VTETEMRALTHVDVGPLYKEKYWDKVFGNDLPAGVDYAVFDCAINSGPGRSIKFLQEAIGTTPDGAVGPKTLAAVKAADPEALVNTLCDKRLAFLQELPTWATFGRGWERRVRDVRATALEMAQG
jgi:lysozyme family protein